MGNFDLQGMKVLIFGFGSIGKKHAQILREFFFCDSVVFRSKRKMVNDLGLREIDSWEEVKELKPDAAIICNPTFLHIDTALLCARANLPFMLEKPIDCSTEKLDLLLEEVLKKKLPTFIAYNLRFHPLIQKTRSHLMNREVSRAHVYCYTNLSRWRPGSRHMESYSAFSSQGGGAILDLSHEFDYIEYLFGKIESIEGSFSRSSNVTVDAEDLVDAIVKTPKGCVTLNINLAWPHAEERAIEIEFKDSQKLKVDLVKNEFVLMPGSRETLDFTIRETYRDEIRFFFENLRNPHMMNCLEEASDLFRKLCAFREGNCKYLPR